VALILLGWGVAQYPWLVRPALTIWNCAAPDSVVTSLLGALAVGAVVLLPSLALLFRVFKSHRTSSSITEENAL
jgi:cytochrome bd ubiquinol oxidase subunit II